MVCVVMYRVKFSLISRNAVMQVVGTFLCVPTARSPFKSAAMSQRGWCNDNTRRYAPLADKCWLYCAKHTLCFAASAERFQNYEHCIVKTAMCFQKCVDCFS